MTFGSAFAEALATFSTYTRVAHQHRYNHPIDLRASSVAIITHRRYHLPSLRRRSGDSEMHVTRCVSSVQRAVTVTVMSAGGGGGSGGGCTTIRLKGKRKGPKNRNTKSDRIPSPKPRPCKASERNARTTRRRAPNGTPRETKKNPPTITGPEARSNLRPVMVSSSAGPSCPE